jgi:hypothetical protein
MENTTQNIFLEIETIESMYCTNCQKKDYKLVEKLMYEKFGALSDEEKLAIFNGYKKFTNGDKHTCFAFFRRMQDMQFDARCQILENLIEENKGCNFDRWFTPFYSKCKITIN